MMLTVLRKYLPVILLMLLSLEGIAQNETEKQLIIQSRIEFISEQLETEEIDLTDVIAQLNYYFDHPLNLNQATLEELRHLSLLSDIQINELLLHRELYGKLISIYELQSLGFWDLATIRRVLPFIKVDDKLEQLHVNIKEILRNGVFEGFIRYQRILEDKSAYQSVPDSVLESSNSYYRGDANKYYTRFRYSYRTNFSIGVTAEKDAGEEFFQGTQPNGFDFYSAHAYYHGGKYLRTVALGDYQIQIGQGLALWSGYAFGKNADVMNIKRSAIPLRPYKSVDESRFFRGAAFELGIGKLSLTSFVSYKDVDATVSLDSLSNEEILASSINLSGLHRTNSEIARKNSLSEFIAGSNLRFHSRAFDAGISGVYQSYGSAYIKDTTAYNQFDFRGKESTVFSADYSWVKRNVNFFGELAYANHSSSIAALQGVLIALDQRASVSFLYRYYDKAYHSFYNAGFSEGSKTQNEQGLYSGLRLTLTRKLTLNSYVDLFSFPWLKYQVDGPSNGHEYLIQSTYKPSRELEIYFRYREQSREKNSRVSDGSVTDLEANIQRNYRLNLAYKVTESVQLKSRIEYVTLARESLGDQEGFIITQDIIYRPKSSPLDLSMRYALFDTDSYDTRIYTYENNALYTFSIPAYYYRGSRAYLLLRYTFARKIDLWVRYGVSIFDNRDSIGSGPEEINGNRKTDLTVQLRVKL